MSRIDPLRGRLGRRDLLEDDRRGRRRRRPGQSHRPGVLPARSALARQDAANAIIFGVGTDVDELDPRTTDTQEGYIACANVYDCLVLYDLGATTIRPGSGRVLGDLRRRPGLHLQPAPGRQVSTTATPSTPTPSSPGTTRSRRGRRAPSTTPPAWSTWTDFITDLDRHRRERSTTFTVTHDPAEARTRRCWPTSPSRSPAWSARPRSPQGLDDAGRQPVRHRRVHAGKPGRLDARQPVGADANPDYWGGAPKVDQLIIKVVPESSTRLQQVETGEIDIAWALTPEDVETGAREPGPRRRRGRRAEHQQRQVQRHQGAVHLARRSGRRSTTRSTRRSSPRGSTTATWCRRAACCRRSTGPTTRT